MDWKGLEQEAVDLLREYIRIDTSNPPGNEAPGAEFLAGVLRSEGIEPRIYESEPGRASLVARLEGGGSGRPMVLMSHIDVVPAEAEKWDVDPFAGEMSDGFIWGRGALDMKGMGIMQLLAFIAARREGLELSRDLVFLACADEEAGGHLGCEFMLREHPEELDADVVINEGGFANTTLVPGVPLFMVATAEKYAMWLRFFVKGEGGHGSMPSGRGALERLVLALGRLMSAKQPIEITAPVRALFGALAAHWPILEEFAKDGDVETLKELIVRNNLTALPALNALVRNTLCLNLLNAGVKINVIPDEAEAQIDCRLLPETEPEDFLALVRDSLDDEEIEVELVMGGDVSPESPTADGFFGCIRDTIETDFPGSMVTPFLLPGISDSRFFRRAGVPVYGIIPARLGLEDLSSIHGVNEKILVEDLKQGVRFTYHLIEACAS